MTRVIIPTLHSDQVRAFKLRNPDGTRAKRKAIRCGRRWGKTTYGEAEATNGAVKRLSIGWFAPDYKKLAEAYNEILTILKPVRFSSSKTEGLIRTTTGGRIDFWTLEDENAGRSRKYHKVIIDEGAFTKTPNMLGIWEKAIEPTLLDYGGSATVLSNTNGNDPDNFMYAICNDPKWGFVQYHAPSRNNPLIPERLIGEDEATYLLRREEVFAKLRREKHPLVFQQEYEAEFVDWSGVAFFSIDKMLIGGESVAVPPNCDSVFAVIDSATKTGKANDGTAVVYFAVNKSNVAAPLVILDWDVIQIEGDLLITWLPTVLANLEALSRKTGARAGSLGAFIEDKDSGQILLQAAARKGLSAIPIPGSLTALGKDERAITVSDHVYQGKVKISADAFNKTMTFKETTRNHLTSQVTGFRIGDKDAAKRADDLLDCFTYGVAIALGNADGF
jgi:hypothetical protein